MRISVALATYQGERFLEQQLESIRNQSLLPVELVVGDDGSVDGNHRVVAEFARRAPFPVSLQVHATALGSARNFESVIAECSGDVIALSDQDDLWQPTKLEALAGTLSGPREPGLAFSDGELVDASSASLGVSCWDSIGLSGQQRRAIDSAARSRRSCVASGASAVRSRVRRSRSGPGTGRSCSRSLTSYRPRRRGSSTTRGSRSSSRRSRPWRRSPTPSCSTASTTPSRSGCCRRRGGSAGSGCRGDR